MEIRKIRIENYDYPLIDDRIALHPLEERDRCKLLVANNGGKIKHTVFAKLPLFIKPGTLIIANETKVIRARLDFRKDTGARIEIFLLEPEAPSDYAANFASKTGCVWSCLVGNKKKWKEGPLSRILIIGGEEVVFNAVFLHDIESGGGQIKFSWDNSSVSFAEIVEAAGEIPIPPYLNRESEERDNTDYQTVYSKTQGSVAAPTAGLHFTPELIDDLKKGGNEFITVTLHVGAGTFKPVKSDEIGEHQMHSEWISIHKNTISRIISALEEGRDILAVGTTTVRVLESLPYIGSEKEGFAGEIPKVTQWMPYEDNYQQIDTLMSLRNILDEMRQIGSDSIQTNTSIMIAPGFRWRIVNRLITNFHQPKSTLLLLVSSFLGKDSEGKEIWRQVYKEALDNDYRFLSYGDACLFSRGIQPVDLPLSKSMLLRAATLTAIRYPDQSYLLDKLEVACDDVKNYIQALKLALFSRLEPLQPLLCNIEEGAAPLRFLFAFAASMPGVKLIIRSGETLSRRPILPLVNTLVRMGAFLMPLNNTGEFFVFGTKLKAEKLEIKASETTSQYLSALMLASSLWKYEGGNIEESVERIMAEIESQGKVSRPYVRMTREMIKDDKLDIEPDWSAASYFYQYVLMSGKKLPIKRLIPPARSLQGDSMVSDIFSSLGVNTLYHSDGSATLRLDEEALSLARERGIFEFDFTDSPDLVPAVAVGLCYKKIPFRLTGLGHLKYKESDRLIILQRLLTGVGYGVIIENASLVFNGEFSPLAEFPVEIDSYHDHRIAMAFYPMELMGMVRVENKEVVGKSFPNFYQQFK